MEKRITLYKLISYVQNIVENQESNTEKVYNVTNNKNIDELKFDRLDLNVKHDLTDFPVKLKEIFDPYQSDMFRYGVISLKKDVNLSLYSCILAAIKPEFLKFAEKDQDKIFLDLKKKLVSEYTDKDIFEKKGFLEMGWVKKELKISVMENKNNKMVLTVLADYFNVNILLLNITEDKLYFIYPENKFNVYKPSVFLSYNNDYFELVLYKDNFIWNYKFDPLKKLLNVEKTKINVLDVNFKTTENKTKDFVIGFDELYYETEMKSPQVSIKPNDYNEVFTDESKKNIELSDNEDVVESVEPSKDVKDIFCTLDSSKGKLEELKSEMKKINSRAKLEEIQKLCTKYGVNLQHPSENGKKGKTKTKTELWSELSALE